jgi:hypothetical protein
MILTDFFDDFAQSKSTLSSSVKIQCYLSEYLLILLSEKNNNLYYCNIKPYC